MSRPQIWAAFHCTVASVRPPPAAPLVWKSGRWPALFSASYSDGWTVGRGRELRAPGNSIPTGEPLGQEIPWWVGLLGRRDAPPPQEGRNFFLFVLSSFFFKKHRHMAADGAGAVFGWCVCSCLWRGDSIFLHWLQCPASTSGIET